MAQNAQQKLAAVKAKIAELTKSLPELEAAAANTVNEDNVQAGVNVQFIYGKGESKRTLVGMVLGRKDPAEGEKGGALVKVAIGTGFDAQIVTIYPANVTAILTPEQADAATQPQPTDAERDALAAA